MAARVDCPWSAALRHDLRMLVLGHRGASAAAPENTPDAFALADRLGADGVELDVRRTADGRLLVAHDPLPTSDVDIEALGLSTLDEVLDACGTRMLVNVEIKNSPTEAGYDPTMSMVAPVIDALRRRGARSVDRWLISSFSWSTVAACRALSSDIATACLTSEPIDAATIELIAGAGHRAVHPWEPNVDDDVVERCHRAGLAVNAWTCNEPQRLVQLADLGVDGVCTDVPAVALAALGRAGAVSRPAWSSGEPR
jgi:glycerophosphoryl diester phosphodiesterase